MSIGSMIAFGFLAVVVVASGIAMLLSRNAVYAALFLVLNFVTVAVLYLILGAPFISLVQITVYAGSIMVLFLFVIMLLGADKMPAGEPLRFQRGLALLLGGVFVAELVAFLIFRSELTGMVNPIPIDQSSPAAIGNLLFTKYALPFELTGFVLLVATVGAILLTRSDSSVKRSQTIQKKDNPQ